MNTRTWLEMKIKVAKVAFLICLLTSIGLMVGSFFCPPMGVIDGSVLKAVGELFGFATLPTIWTIAKGRTVTLNHGNTSISLGDDDNQEDKQKTETYE